jgi:hypothetical protein
LLEQMRIALQAWAKFPVKTSHRPLVLTSDPVSGPADGFRTDDAKEAFLTGLFIAPVVLPSGPQDAGGHPVVTAAQALAAMRAEGTPAVGNPHRPTPLVVTSIRFGESSFATDRGTRALPAWLFSFADVQNPVAVLAVAPSSRFAAPGQSSASVGARLGPDGRTATITFVGAQPGNGPCGADYTVFQIASDNAVALYVRETPHHAADPNVACSAVGYQRREVTVFGSPLGNRVLVDTKTKAAVQVAP